MEIIRTEIELKKEIKKRDTAERREIFNSIYGVELFGSYNKTKNTVTKNSVLELFKDDYLKYRNKGINSLLSLYKKYSYAIFFNYSPSSIRNNLVAFKNIIRNNGGKYQANALETFKIDAIYAPMKKKDADRKERTTKKVLSGEGSNGKVTKESLEAQINLLKDELKDRTYSVSSNQKEEQVRAYRILFLLVLSTGRRFTELLKTLVIEKKGRKTIFKGLLKGNVDAIEGHIIGLTYKEVKGQLKELRAYAKSEDMAESEINQKYAKVFNNALKRFGDRGLIVDDLLAYFKSVKREVKGELINGEPNLKGCRDIYAIVGSELFFDETIDRDRTQTASRILGHNYVIQSSEGYLNK